MDKKIFNLSLLTGVVAIFGTLTLLFLILGIARAEKIKHAVRVLPAPASMPVVLAPEKGTGYEIKWEFTEYDFGILEKGTPNDSVTFSFEVLSEVAQITGSVSNCGCTLGEWKPTVLKRGETGSVTIKYDTERVGYFNKTFEIFINRNDKPEILRIKGNVKGE